MPDTQTPDSLRPGDLVGPWRIEGYAGRGAYGAVYRARRAGHPSAIPVALKIALFPADPRFSREVEVLSRNRHPGIPQLLDRGWWHASAEVSHPYLVMEWIRGRPLYEWARMHNPTCREVLLVLAQVAWALEVLHRGECLHRDVKGDNILIEPEGRALLTDFGSSTWKGAPPLTERVIPPNTRQYRSPESLRFEWSNWRTKGAHYETRPADDLYALGVAAYRLVTGVYPPPGTDPEALKEHFQVPLPQRRPPHEFNKRVVPELSALIERMLAKEPEARGTAREIAEAAESAAERARPEANVPFLDLEWEAAPPAVEGPPAKLRSQPRRPGFAAATFVLLVMSTCWMSPGPQGELPKLVQAEAPDAGTRGLGDSTPTTRLTSQEPPVAPGNKAISQQVPEKPLPGQMHAPCRGQGQLEINGGCWRRFADPPPCEDGIYEWKGACYWPVPQRPRVQPRTSKPQR
jgi:serine/threonine protein kinase